MRRIVLVVAVGAALFGLVLPANAAVTAASVQGYELQHAPPSPVGIIGGNITCTAGQEFLLRVNLRQGGEVIAIGKAGGTCTGSQQSWQTSRLRTYGNFDCSAPFEFGGQARTEDGDRRKLVDNVPACSP